MPIRITLLIVLLLQGFFIKAQSRYRFFTLGIEKGLSGPFTWSICQDKYGFMWIGTSKGLNRYDGHSIRQYLHDPKDSTSIPGDIVYWIFKDKDGDMWFACGRQGLVKYNYASDRFEKFDLYEKTKKNKYGSPVWRIYADNEGRIYLCCGGALLRYTKQTGKLDDLTPQFKGQIDDWGIAMVLPQGKDKLWILADNGLYFYDLVKNTAQKVPFDEEKMGYGLSAMHDAEFINNEVLLITMGRPGFVLFNTRTWQFNPPPSPLDPHVTKRITSTGGVLKDSKGRIWLSNSLYGLSQYVPETNEFISLKNEPSYPYPFPEQEGQGMIVYEDRDGNIWYGNSLRGVVWFQPELDFIKTYSRDYSNPSSLPDDNVPSLRPAANGEMLISTFKGLSIFNAEKNSFKSFLGSINSTGIFPPTIWGMDESGDSVFMATNMGLSIYNQKTGSFYRLVNAGEKKSNPFALFRNQLYAVHYTQPGELILFNDQAARFDLNSGKCYYKENSGTSDPLYQFSDINSTVHDKSRKKLWLESGKGELYEYDLVTKKAIHHTFTTDTSIKTITKLHCDIDGSVWIGTPKALIHYNTVSKKYGVLQLPTVSQHINNFHRESNEIIWVTTSKEIIRLNQKTNQSQIYDLNQALPYCGIYRDAFYMDKNAQLWIGTSSGFCVVNTKKFHTHEHLSAPHLVNFTVFDKKKIFDEPYAVLKNIELNHNENFFSFDFSALDFHQANNLQYSYKLEGFDKDWKTSTKNSASYTNVPPGTYTLHLRTQHSAGKWEEASPITLHIRPPFYKSAWFIILITLVLAATCWRIFVLIQKRKTQKNIEETIDYFANSQYGENSISEICWDIARNCIAQLKLEDCVVYLFDEKKNLLVQRAAYGPKNPREHEIINPMEIELGKGIVGTAASTCKPVLVKDTTKDSRYIIDDNYRLSELAVPIVHEGKAIGVIDSENSRKNFFTEDHIKVLSTIAAISANKIAEARAEDAVRDHELQLLEIKKLLAESQLMALRAQMNPHFVFNCLNSIQECIVTEKYGDASLYLNKFSKLFRSVLNNSGKLMVTLNEEIEVLELYLALEHMRFEKSFDYKIHVDEELEADEILIPSMLVQPYVENALWHGLMHKNNDRQLNICFKRISEDVFQCKIDDNGIGRRKALELKEQQSKTKRHVSKGMSISKDRVELLQKQGQHARLEIIDKHDEKGFSTGTRVVVELSTYLKAT